MSQLLHECGVRLTADAIAGLILIALGAWAARR
jgi:hypothetical protein